MKIALLMSPRNTRKSTKDHCRSFDFVLFRVFRGQKSIFLSLPWKILFEQNAFLDFECRSLPECSYSEMK